MNSLHFESSVNLPPKNYKSLNSLEHLRQLELIKVNTEMLNILKTKCMNQLTELKIIYTSVEQHKTVNRFYLFYVFAEKELNDLPVSRCKSPKGLMIARLKLPLKVIDINWNSCIYIDSNYLE